MIPLRPRPRLEHDTPPRNSQPRHQLHIQPLRLLSISPEQTPALSLPNHKTSHELFIRRRPAVFKIHSSESLVARVIAIKGAVLVQQVAFCDKTGIDIAVFQVDRLLSCVQNVWDLLASVLTHGALEDKEMAVGEDDVAA